VKEKTAWQLGFGALAVILVLAVSGTMPGLSTEYQGAEQQPVVTTDNIVGVVVSCYQEEEGVTYGLLDSDITILDQNGAAVYPKKNSATGTLSLDTSAGFRKGSTYTVVCEKNAATGAYRAEKTVKFDKDLNAVEVPMKKVGVPSVTFSSINGDTVTMGESDYQWTQIDIATKVSKTWLYKPVIAIKDVVGHELFSNNMITKVEIPQATQVPCDTNLAAMSQYKYCFIVNQEWVSNAAPVSNLRIFLTSKDVLPADGQLVVSIFDSVPSQPSGVVSINEVNAYATDQGDVTVLVNPAP